MTGGLTIRKVWNCLAIFVLACGFVACGVSDPTEKAQYELMRAITRGDSAYAARLLVTPGLDVNWQAKGVGPTPLSAAIQAHQLDIAKLLIARDADPNIPGREGYTALQSAASDGDIDAARLLLEAGADVNAVHTRYGYTPLAVAVLNGHAEIVRMLLRAGADPSVKIKDGTAILEIAEKKHRADIVDMLKAAATSVNAKQ